MNDYYDMVQCGETSLQSVFHLLSIVITWNSKTLPGIEPEGLKHHVSFDAKCSHSALIHEHSKEANEAGWL